MANIKGRNVRVEIAATYGSDVTVSAVTQALPGVATATSHGQANGTVGYFHTVGGMAQLEKQAVRVANQATNSFELQGLNTTAYAAYTSGLFKPVATWSTLAESTSYEISGGAGEKLDVTTLLDIVRKEEQGLLPTQTVNVGVLAQDVPTAATQLLEAAAQAGGIIVVRVSIGTTAVRIFCGEPSLAGESVQVGAIGSGSLDFAVKGFALKLSAA